MKQLSLSVLATVITILGAGAQAPAAQPAPAKLTVESPAFKDGGAIPKEFTGDTGAKNISPALTWSGAPATTKEFALILDDPDANFGGRGPFVHWVLTFHPEVPGC